MKRNIVYIIGPSTETRGGIGYVIGTHLKSSLADRFELIHIVTQREGGALTKALTYAAAVTKFVFLRLARGGKLVHIHSSTGPSLFRKVLLFMVSRCMGCRVIFQIHSGHFLDYYANSRYLVRCLIDHVLRSARLNVALTDSWGRKIKALTVGCAPVEIVANPIDTSIYKPRLQRTCPSQPPQLLFLGAIIRAKGVYDLVESFKLLKSQGLEPHITMAGDREIDQVKAHCKEAGVEGLFDFPGWVSETQKLNLLWRSDLLVLPSYGEGLPLCVLEAMACGLPIVCTDVGGLSDLVKHGENGFLFKPGEIGVLARHIATLLNDDLLRQRMGQSNIARIERDYSINVIAKKIEKIYGDELGLPLAPLAAGPLTYSPQKPSTLS